METISRKGTIRRCGHIWEYSNMGYENDWTTTIDKRFHISTWKFGNIHQSVVFIDYDHKIDGQSLNSIKNDGSVHIGLRPGKTMEGAMKICLNWVDEFQKSGPPSLEQVFQNSWDHWPTLYPKGKRLPVIDHIFFTIGGGYNWVDGAIICTNPQDYLENAKRRKNEGIEEALEAADELRQMIREQKMAQGEELEYWDYTREEQNNMHWDQDVYSFYPASEDYSNVCLVPDDVKPEWLKLSYEAALLLRDKSGLPKMPPPRDKSNNEEDKQRQENNRALGSKVVADLERRFPHVKENQQVSP